MKSKEIARIFIEIAQILELKGENVFRVRAYERASQTIEGMGEELERLDTQEKLTTIDGIGNDLAKKIHEYLASGSLSYYEALKKEIPAGLMQMLQIPGLGPKTVKLFWERLKIDSIGKLKAAAEAGKLRRLEGVKEKTEENILRGIGLLKAAGYRTPLPLAIPVADEFVRYLEKVRAVRTIAVAGSLRRRKETIKDIDILVTSNLPRQVMRALVASPLVGEVIAEGPTKSSVIAQAAPMQVDVRVVAQKSFGSALLYFTGSKAFNVALRGLANRKGYKINEYGMFAHGAAGKEKLIASKTEADIFSRLGMDYIEPELREDRGEIACAQKRTLPRLITAADMRGDLHVHSTYGDGKNSIREVAEAAQKRGYAYIGITDHSQGLRIARGLSLGELHKKIDEVRDINKHLRKFRLFCGAEVDILADGALDYPDSALKELDYVVAAIHSGFKQSKQQLTRRLVRACQNKYVRVIAHPTGVLWGARPAYEVDFEELYRAAADYQVALEINAYPHRFDLSDTNVMNARNYGVVFAIDTDSHEVADFAFMDFGVDIARRGWLRKDDVINCLDTKQLEAWFKR